MRKRILAIGLIAMFLAVAVIPTGFATNTDQVVITYGETTYMSQQYKSVVDNYFAGYESLRYRQSGHVLQDPSKYIRGINAPCHSWGF